MADRVRSSQLVLAAILAVLLVAWADAQAPPPSAPANPSPLVAATGVSLSTTLSWDAVAGTSYGIKLAVTERGLDTPQFFATGVTSTGARGSYALPTLHPTTTYYWQVVANPGPAQVAGDVWSFTTVDDVPQSWWDWLQPFVLPSSLLVALAGILKWFVDRNNRATDVLLKLEDEFHRKCTKARPMIEYDDRYDQIKAALRRGRDARNDLADIDDFLRFYIVVYAVIQARQVPYRSLSIAYRFWLAHYYCADRAELRAYVNSYYPTLAAWLQEDASWYTGPRARVGYRVGFFRPSFWAPEELVLDAAELRKDRVLPTAAVRKRGGRVLVVTGAGISADSGIPTFRGSGGYWRSFNPSDLATTGAFQRDPNLVWQWYRERRARIAASAPNAAHEALVRLGLACQDFLLITQNVDDLHTRARYESAGLPPGSIVQIHGDIFVSRCERCDFSRRRPDDDVDPVPDCPKCGARLRPGVVWFDEELDPRDVGRIETFLAGGRCDLVLVIGTTAQFDYIRRWIEQAAQPDGRIVEINPEDTPLSARAEMHLRERAAAVVPRIVNDFLI